MIICVMKMSEPNETKQNGDCVYIQTISPKRKIT